MIPSSVGHVAEALRRRRRASGKTKDATSMTLPSPTSRLSPALLLLLLLSILRAAPPLLPVPGVADALSSDTPPPSRASPRHYPSGRDRPHGYEILSDDVVYSGWRTVVRRRVRSPNHRPRRVIDFDVVDQKNAAGAVIVFAWDADTKTATIVREYMPGCHRVLGGLAAGLVERDKHAVNGENDKDDSGDGAESGLTVDESLIAARCELEEECHLSEGVWYRLTDESVPMDKYVSTEITAYLVVNPSKVDDPRPLDDEEDIEIVEGVSPDDIMRMIREGDMNLVGGWASMLALAKLRELGEIP